MLPFLRLPALGKWARQRFPNPCCIFQICCFRNAWKSSAGLLELTAFSMSELSLEPGKYCPAGASFRVSGLKPFCFAFAMNFSLLSQSRWASSLNPLWTRVLFQVSSGKQHVLLPACGTLLCTVKAWLKMPVSHGVQDYLHTGTHHT